MQKAKLTGLWKNTGKDGKTYLSGTLGLSKLMVYPNDYKKAEKDPDYIAYLVQPDKDEKKAAPETPQDL